MKTLIQTPNNKSAKLATDIYARLNELEQERNVLESAIQYLEVNRVEVERVNSKVKVARRPQHRGNSQQLLEILKNTNEGEFTIESALQHSKEHKMGQNRVDIMNCIQNLIRKGFVKIVSAGRGRRIAVYGLKKGKKTVAAQEPAAVTS